MAYNNRLKFATQYLTTVLVLQLYENHIITLTFGLGESS